jgi:hypothetical protein
LESASTHLDTVEFSYVIEGSAGIAIPRAWWEQLGSPESVEVTVVPAERA